MGMRRVLGAILNISFLILLILPFTVSVAWAVEKKPSGKTFDLGEGVKLELEQIPAGSFMMGSPDNETCKYRGETPSHKVTLNIFFLGKYEVTAKQFKRFIKSTGYRTDAEKEGWVWSWDNKKNKLVKKMNQWHNQPGYGEGDNRPVTCVSWNDTQAFCRWLQRTTGWQFRLPTEAEWEYACRGGQAGAYFTGNDLTACTKNGTSKALNQAGWYLHNSNGKLHPVGLKKPNIFGLYDMHGNVGEWCQDFYDIGYYQRSIESNPFCTASQNKVRVVRGGAYMSSARGCRSAFRDWGPPKNRSELAGFRVLALPGIPKR